MTNEFSKIIVKVGNKSKVKFSYSKVYRAITIEDLVRLSNIHNDCHIVIIENILSEEQDTLKQFAIDFKNKDKQNVMLFYLPEDDEVTSGVADELDYDIYLNLSDLYDRIYKDFKINVSTLMKDRRRINSLELQEGTEGLTDIFGSTDTDSNDNLSDDLKTDLDTPTIENPIESSDSDSDSESNLVETSSSDETSDEFDEDNISFDKEQSSIKVPTSTINDSTPEKSTKTKADKNKIERSDTSKSNETVDISDTPVEKKSSPSTKKSTSVLDSDTNEIINNLKRELNDSKYDYDEIKKSLRKAEKTIDSLENTVRVLTDEKEEMIKRSNELFDTTEVLEQPISLVEYEGLKDRIETLENNISSLKSTIERDKDIIANKETEISSNIDKIKELQDKLDSNKTEISSLKESIASGEAYKDKAEEFESKIEDIQSEKDSILKEKEKLQGKIEEYIISTADLQNRIDELTKEIEKGNALKLESDEITSNSKKEIDKLNDEINSKKELISDLESNVDKLNKDIEENNKKHSSEVKTLKSKISSLEKEKKDLDDKVATTDKRIELSEQFAETEKQKLNDEITSLKTKLKITSEQLKSKETQYSDLVRTSGIDEAGASALVETNKTLETVVKTLREQLGASQLEVEKLTKQEQSSRGQAAKLQAQVKQLNDTISAVAGGKEQALKAMMSGTLTVKPIKYTGQARVISVFGTGNGTTTFAMSLARKLATSSATVLYLDFDLVTPSADAWFIKTPYIEAPGVPVQSKETALGAFFKYGISVIESGMAAQVNPNNKIIRAVQKIGKGGALDYLSGSYTRVENSKLANADYTALFNYLGSRYQYIIVDFGRLGCNDVADQIIRTVCNISVKGVVVTSNDGFEARNMRNKLIENKFKLDRIAWLVNKCEATKIDEAVKKTVDTISNGLMLYDPAIANKRDVFGFKNKIMVEKFESFINYAVFSKTI